MDAGDSGDTIPVDGMVEGTFVDSVSTSRRPLSRAMAMVRGAMLTAAAGVVGLAPGAPAALAERGWAFQVALGASALLLLAAGVLPRSPRAARILMWLGLVGGTALAAPALARSPALALLAILLAVGASLALSRPSPAQVISLGQDEESVATARGAAAGSTGLWLLVAGGAGASIDSAAVPLGVCAMVASLLVARWLLAFGHRHSIRRALLLAAGIIISGVLPFLVGRWGAFLGVVAIFPAVALLVLPLSPAVADDDAGWFGLLFSHPPRLLVLTFALLCLAGTLALSLPFASASDRPVAHIDAFFTAVSAVCVTGLIVVDTPVVFSAAGEAIIALLIQLGGLGIMTFSTAALALLGRRLSMVHEGVMTGIIGGPSQGQIYQAVKRVLVVTAVSEGVGAALLSILFWSEGDRFWSGLWRGVFTAVSAFCNAGFALQTDNLVGYSDNPGILATVAALIILGGISPFVTVRLPRVVAGRFSTAQEKLVVVTTAILIVAGAALFAALEWNASMSSLSIGDKITNAVFQSVTLRTAGFNSVDFGQITGPTLGFMLVWMFIGGSPGSTAGGIKTTTAAVLVLAVLATVRGHKVAVAFHRRIPHPTIYRATAIVTMGATAVFLGFLVIAVTQRMPGGHAIFEVVSALGTVGLSVGGTALLDDLGKLVIIVCMFTGRLGPLTLFMFLTRKSVRESWTHPEEDIQVG